MIPDGLKEVMGICGISPTDYEIFLDIVSEGWKNGYRGNVLLDSVCDHGYSELLSASERDKNELLVAIERFEEGGGNIRLQDTEHYLDSTMKRDGTEVVTGIKHKLFADDLIAIYHFKTLRDTEEVIYYDNGFYHYEGEAIIRGDAERVFGEHLNSYRVNEILNHIRRSTYIKREEVNSDLWTLNLENGLFNIKTFEFNTHTPTLLTTIRIPLKYDPEAKCPQIEKFISEIVYPEHVKLIKEIIGYCLYHDYTYQNWFLLHGEGANGKSRLLSLIGKFLGEENVSSIGLQDLNQRFAPVNLYAKSANVVADMSDADLKRTARLKQLTGGDLITAEPKFKNAFTYFNFAKLIYSCNKVPLTEDKSRAFFRRVIFIPFPNTFTVGENADEYIMDKITTEEELSGLLNVAVASLKHMIGNGGFSGYLTAEENEELYERASNPVYGFFHDCCELNVEKYIVKMDFTDAFFEYCKEKKVVAFSEKKFIQEMRLLTRMEDEQKTLENGYRKRVWKGITLKDTAQDTHHTHHFPILKESVDKIDKNNKIDKYSLGRENPVQGVQGVQDNSYAKCEMCEKDATLTSCNLNGKKIGICDKCRKDLEYEKANTPPQPPTTPLICVCGKKFDTQEVLQTHQSKCKKYQAKQDKEAREEIKKGEVPDDKNTIHVVQKIINGLETRVNAEVTVEKIIYEAADKGVNQEQVEEAIEKLKLEGVLFVPKKGVVEFAR